MKITEGKTKRCNWIRSQKYPTMINNSERNMLAFSVALIDNWIIIWKKRRPKWAQFNYRTSAHDVPKHIR